MDGTRPAPQGVAVRMLGPPALRRDHAFGGFDVDADAPRFHAALLARVAGLLGDA